jgi:predicted nucleic acid-binding protein
MSVKAFVDTNVLVYAHDSSAAEKYERAKSLVQRLWTEKAGVVSTQVLQEFYVTVRKKVLRPCDVGTAKRWLSHYVNWRVIEIDGSTILEAIDIERRYQLSFWDALIVQAANRAGTTLLYSEDLNSDQRYGTVRVENPFLTTQELDE